MRKAIALLLLVSLSAIEVSAAEAPDKKITTAQARALVLASLTPDQKRLPKVGAEQYDDPNSSRFVFFTVFWEGTPKGSVVVGNYAVDPYTGDVFSATIGCEEKKNKKLQALQRQIRATLHLSQSEYQRLKTKGPLCDE
jgi:hypothetical protein